MRDLIDRQAVIDILAEMQGLCTSKAALVQNSKIWQQIKDLPSVILPIKEKCQICPHCDHCDVGDDGVILPSAQPEVIRCKDCAHYHEDVWGDEIGHPEMPIILGHEMCDFWGSGCKTKPDAFCSFAERK